MKALETKVPPLVVVLACAALMWGISLFTPVIELDKTAWYIAMCVPLDLGVIVIVASVISFRRARTTVNPLKPQDPSALVRSGMYRISRNPMYVGMALVLVGWTVYLSAPVAAVGVVVFIWTMNTVQIIPEEHALEELFGRDFQEYKSKVRRWL